MKEKRDYPALRKCEYDPTEDLIVVAYGNGNDSETTRQLYLEVKYRIFWFNKWCEENGKVGVIDCSEHHDEPMMPGVSVTAKIYVDDKLFASAVAGECYIRGDFEHNMKAIQTAATRAVGRALANAGFGTIASGVPAEEGDSIPVDSGITVERSSDNPLLFVRRKAEPEASPVKEEPEKSESNDSEHSSSPAVQEMCNPTAVKASNPTEETGSPEKQLNEKQNATAETEPEKVAVEAEDDELKKALATVMPIGKYKGMTMGEVAEKDLRTVQWYASDAFDVAGRRPEVKNAAIIIAASMKS